MSKKLKILIIAGPIWLGDNSSVTKRVIEHLNLKVDEVKWFSTYHVHTGASAFRRGAACV